MKNFFKKHDLLKIVGIAFIVTAILTWLIPSGSFSGTDYIEGELARMSLYDLFISGVYSVNYFVLQFSFILVLGAFYGLLSKTGGYKALVNTIAKKIKGYETLFVLIISALFAILASVSSDVWHLVMIAPFIISIILKSKMSKLTALSTTFGAILVGLLGATFSGFGLSYINNYLGTEFQTLLLIKFVVLLVGFVLFSFFNITHINKTLKEKNVDEEDPFEVEDDKKANIWPTVIVLGLMTLLVLIGYFDWKGVLEVEFFNNIHKSVIEFTIKDHAIFSYILGDITAFGTWDLLMVQIMMVLTMIIMKFVGRIKFDDAIDGIAEGMKKMLQPLFIILIINCLFMFNYWAGFTTTIYHWILGITDNFNLFTMTLAGLVGSIFHVDFAYTGYALGSWLTTAYADSSDIIMLILNGTNGLMQMLTPTSLVLMTGLSYLGVKYTEWFKYIWKFLVGMLVVLLLIYVMLVYI